MAREYNTFLGVGLLKKIMDDYQVHPLTTKTERHIAFVVKEYGETKDLHTFYLSFIISILDNIVTTQKLVLAYGSRTKMVNYARWYELECIANTIYLLRKGSLGLNSFSCSTEDMNFREATKNCDTSIDFELVDRMVEQIKTLTIIQMDKLELEIEENVMVSLGAFSDKFCFHKILALVIQICFQVGLHKVDGVDTWAFYVAAYEIAHKIEADYNSADLEEGIA